MCARAAAWLAEAARGADQAWAGACGARREREAVVRAASVVTESGAEQLGTTTLPRRTEKASAGAIRRFLRRG